MRYFSVLIIAGLLAGCASPARVDQMVATPQAGVTLPDNSPLRAAMVVGSVIGGERTNPLWTSEVDNPQFQQALEKSLQAAGMLATGDPKYRLNAALVKLDQPIIGFDFEVVSHVKYTVVEAASGKQVFERTMDAAYTAKMSDAFVGVERLRLANEGSIRTNIAKLMDALREAGPNFGASGPATSSLGMGRVTAALTP